MLILLLLAMAAALLGGCACFRKEEKADETADTGRLISFYYSYNVFRSRPFEYTIERTPDQEGQERILFKAEGYSQNLFSIEEEIDEAVLEDLVRIMEEENILAWDGFRQYDMEVRDGFGFTLRAAFENRTITASGYMKEPENFKAGHQRLSDYLLTLVRSLEED